jgi:replication factor C small subunit
LDSYVRATYPDLRKCLNLVQQNSQNGQLSAPNSTDRSIGDWKLDCVDLFKQGKIREARTLMCQQSTPEEADEIFRWMYDNLDLWSRIHTNKIKQLLLFVMGLVNVPIGSRPRN